MNLGPDVPVHRHTIVFISYLLYGYNFLFTVNCLSRICTRNTNVSESCQLQETAKYTSTNVSYLPFYNTNIALFTVSTKEILYYAVSKHK